MKIRVKNDVWTTMDFGPQQIGKWLIWVGIIIALVGALMAVLGRIGLFRLPGDLEFGSKSWRIYFPIASCILISIVLTLFCGLSTTSAGKTKLYRQANQKLEPLDSRLRGNDSIFLLDALKNLAKEPNFVFDYAAEK